MGHKKGTGTFGEATLGDYPFTARELLDFIQLASVNTYAGGAERDASPERPGFIEYTFSQDNWDYRDSYTGFRRSRGMELVRYAGEPVWASAYGGGMLKGKKELARETFKFLKQALAVTDKGFDSFRGPHEMKLGKWDYRYTQDGNVEEFAGEEEIRFENERLFYHKIIGGLIRK